MALSVNAVVVIAVYGETIKEQDVLLIGNTSVDDIFKVYVKLFIFELTGALPVANKLDTIWKEMRFDVHPGDDPVGSFHCEGKSEGCGRFADSRGADNPPQRVGVAAF